MGIYETYLIGHTTLRKAYLLLLLAKTRTSLIYDVVKHVPAWFPGAAFKKQALQWREANRMMLNVPLEKVQQIDRIFASDKLPTFADREDLHT